MSGCKQQGTVSMNKSRFIQFCINFISLNNWHSCVHFKYTVAKYPEREDKTKLFFPVFCLFLVSLATRGKISSAISWLKPEAVLDMFPCWWFYNVATLTFPRPSFEPPLSQREWAQCRQHHGRRIAFTREAIRYGEVLHTQERRHSEDNGCCTFSKDPLTASLYVGSPAPHW